MFFCHLHFTTVVITTKIGIRDPCILNKVFICCRRNSFSFTSTYYMLNLLNWSLMVWLEEIMRAFESVVGKRFVGASKQAKPKQKLVVEGSEKKDDNQEFFDAEIRRRVQSAACCPPAVRSFASRARGFSRATSFSAPMIKIGNSSSRSSLPPSRRWTTENLIFQLLSGTRTPNIG